MKNDDTIIEEAKKRFEASLSAFSSTYEKQRADQRFAAASPDDPWQWDDVVRQKRELQLRPTITINKLPQHIRQVTNDVRQNRPAVKYRPVSDEATVECAEILNGIVRNIEYISDADIAYDTACDNQVTHGLGYIRVYTDYCDDETFDQDILIGRVTDVFRVHDDPDALDPAGADRKWLMFEEQLSEDEFKKLYPDADPIDWAFATTAGDWFNAGEKKIRIVEYFKYEDKEKTLNLWSTGETSLEGEPVPFGVFDPKPVRTRKVTVKTVKWYKLNGQQILEERDFPGKLIPWARVVGNDFLIDGKRIFSGLVRNAKDSQRMYNVAQSAIVERVMQAPKAPFIAPVEAIEGYETAWKTANTENHAYLPYNHVDDEGNPLPVPQRISPATIETGLTQIAQSSSDDIKAETGQYDASLGARSNETSGRAIMARQRESDTATFHYVDNLARAIRHIGRIILGMIPVVYDTRRVMRIIGEDDEQNHALLDPNHTESQTEIKEEQSAVKQIFNPNLGRYDVQASSGPSYATKRVEALDAMTQMTQANPQLWQVIGDLMVKNMDWPGAEEMSKRLKATLLPAVQNEEAGDIPPAVQQQLEQMAQQLEQCTQALQQSQQEAMSLKEEKESDVRKLIIEAYNAETNRLKVVGAAMTPEQVHALVMQTLTDVFQNPSPGQLAQEEISEIETAEHQGAQEWLPPQQTL